MLLSEEPRAGAGPSPGLCLCSSVILATPWLAELDTHLTAILRKHRHVAVVMTEVQLRHASGFIGVSLCDPAHVKPRQPSGCPWWAEGTSLPVFDPGRGLAVPGCESTGSTWLTNDGKVYLALLRPLKSSWGKEVIARFHYFYSLLFQLVSTTHTESLPSKTHRDCCSGLACDFHGRGGPGAGLVGLGACALFRRPGNKPCLHTETALTQHCLLAGCSSGVPQVTSGSCSSLPSNVHLSLKTFLPGFSKNLFSFPH